MEITDWDEKTTIHNYVTLNIELLGIYNSSEGFEPNEYQMLIQNYLAAIKTVERRIIEKQLWN